MIYSERIDKECSQMRKKVFKFFFPIPTIVITILIFFIFTGLCYEETPNNFLSTLAMSLTMTLIFYIIIMIPFDIIVYLIWKLLNRNKNQ